MALTFDVSNAAGGRYNLCVRWADALPFTDVGVSIYIGVVFMDSFSFPSLLSQLIIFVVTFTMVSPPMILNAVFPQYVALIGKGLTNVIGDPNAVALSHNVSIGSYCKFR